MQRIPRGVAAGLVSLTLALVPMSNVVSASAATVGSITSDFVSDNDTEFSAVSPDKSIMAVSYYSANEIYFINTATGASTLVSDPGSDVYKPGGVVFSPDGSTLYVANYNNGSGGSVLVIDVATSTVTDNLTSSDFVGPWSIAISADGGTLFVGEYIDDSIVTYDLATDATTSVGSLSHPYVMFLSANGSTLYNVDYDGSIDVYDVGSGSVTDTWTDLTSYSPYVYGACTNGDKSIMYAVDNYNSDVISVSLVDGSILQSAGSNADAPGYYSCVISPDDASLLVTAGDVGDSSSPDFVATVPGQVFEFKASDLSLVKTVDLDNVAYTQQIQMVGTCTALVAGYYGYAQSVEFDSGSCASAPELPNTGMNTAVGIAAGAIALAGIATGALAIVIRRRQA